MLTEAGERDLQAVYGRWAARDERDAQRMTRGFSGDWWVVGGRAVEAFTGVPPPHEDIDIALLRTDLAEFRAVVGARYHLWVVSDGAMAPLWPDEPDPAPPDFLQLRQARSAGGSAGFRHNPSPAGFRSARLAAGMAGGRPSVARLAGCAERTDLRLLNARRAGAGAEHGLSVVLGMLSSRKDGSSRGPELAGPRVAISPSHFGGRTWQTTGT